MRFATPYEERYNLFFFFYLSEAPLIYLSPGRKYFIEGSPVTVTCTASGKPPPDVAWIRNGVLESSGKESASLEFDNINRKDAGQYTCRANNSVEVTSNDTKIVVYCKYILTLIFYSWMNFIHSATPVNGVQVHKTDESVQKCKETEFHLKSFSALYALVPYLGWDIWIQVESLSSLFCFGGSNNCFSNSLHQ